MVRILDVQYLAPRCVYWFLLLAVAVGDALINRTKKRRGYQLHRGVITVIAAYVVQDVLLLSFSILSNKSPVTAGRVCQSYIFFTDLADALMIVGSPPCYAAVHPGPCQALDLRASTHF